MTGNDSYSGLAEPFPLAAIAAMTPDRVIGFRDALPWHHPADLRFFKQTTLGHPVLMGRRTFESIGRPLPGRLNLVWTRAEKLDGHEPDETRLALVRDPATDLPPLLTGLNAPLFVIGGAMVYRALLPHCSHVYLTLIEESHEGDTWLPPFEQDFQPPETLAVEPPCRFLLFKRRQPPTPWITT